MGRQTPILIGTAATARVRAAGQCDERAILLQTDEATVTSHAARTDGETEPHPGAEGPREATFRATRTGWHAAAAVRGVKLGTTDIVITWLTDALAPPNVSNQWTRKWLQRAGASAAERNIEHARELARYFLLGWTGPDETNIGRKLHEHPDDPYPELSQLGLANKYVLKMLTDRPEGLDDDEWKTVAEMGATTARMLGWEAHEEQV